MVGPHIMPSENESRDDPERAASLLHRKGLGDDAHVVGRGACRAEALDHTRTDERGERGRKAAQKRAEGKERHPRLEEPDLAKEVAQPAEDEHGGAANQQIDARDPLDIGRANAELALHSGQGNR